MVLWLSSFERLSFALLQALTIDVSDSGVLERAGTAPSQSAMLLLLSEPDGKTDEVRQGG